jgi:hypothetical protein
VHDAREKHKRQQAGSKRNGEISIKKINGEKRKRISTSRSRSRLDLGLWYSVNLPIIYVFLMLSALLNWSAAGRLRASCEVLTRARDRLIMIVAMSAVPPSPNPVSTRVTRTRSSITFMKQARDSVRRRSRQRKLKVGYICGGNPEIRNIGFSCYQFLVPSLLKGRSCR